MINVLVTGASGQLGQALQFISNQYPELSFYFANSVQGDITNTAVLEELFAKFHPKYCINAAAYTAVDKAESEAEKAALINIEGSKNLALACKKYNCRLVHISTDFVFDGTKSEPYKETDVTNPIGIYGKTKLEGEKRIEALLPEHYIVRTSWVYSQFGNNFMKTMLRLGSERDQLNVVSDQLGTPTHAVDLAQALLSIVDFEEKHQTENFGIYNFSNEGKTSWYDFACEIFRKNNVNIKVNPIPSSDYPTPAKRPAYSVLDKSLIKQTFDIKIRPWKDAL